MIKFCSLSSGSCGNATYIEKNKTKILIDAGLNGVQTKNALENIGVDVSEIDAIVVSHEHKDHVAGVGVLSRRYEIDVYASENTAVAMQPTVKEISHDKMKIIEKKKGFYIKDIFIEPFELNHDAVETLGFNLYDDRGKKLSFMTDTGYVSSEVSEKVKNSDLYFIEANYDKRMLMEGFYPLELKKRILSERGHLSNEDCADFLSRKLVDRNELIFLAHLSADNNNEKLAYMSVYKRLVKDGHERKNFRLRITHRMKRTEVYEL